ncbi:MAG TPA: hypothetical protein P5121_22725, partial [Caldilineaceae bacterium]|nr:hypothetical protein [Caldilineaceae bacterium]
MRYILSILLPVMMVFAACQPIVAPGAMAPAEGATEGETTTEELTEPLVDVNFYTSHAAHERFAKIDLVSGIATDVAKYENPEVEILRTAWFIGDGAIYEDAFYVILNKRLTVDDTPEDAQARLGKVDMQTGAVELLGEVIPLNVIALEVDACGQIFTAGFTLSNQIGELFGDTNLYRVDRESGALSLIGDTGLERIMDLSFDPEGTLWGTTGNVLYTLDMKTGAPTEMAKITGTEDDLEIMGIAFTSEGELYGTTPYADAFYRIDPATGVVTEVGRHGLEFMHGGDIPMEIQGVDCEATAEESTTEASSSTEAKAGVAFYTSQSGHERFGMIDLATGTGTDIGKYENDEVEILRTDWAATNGALYEDTFYIILNKRLPSDATPDQAESRLARVDMQTGAAELVGSVINLNLNGLEINSCGEMFATGFSFSSPLGEWFGDTNLYSVNRESGSLTLIGDTGLERIMALSFAPDGTLWATVGNVLYTLDQETGTPTEVTTITGVEDGNEIMGLGFTSDGDLYGTTP